MAAAAARLLRVQLGAAFGAAARLEFLYESTMRAGSHDQFLLKILN
jgi:hypothetical protein